MERAGTKKGGKLGPGPSSCLHHGVSDPRLVQELLGPGGRAQTLWALTAFQKPWVCASVWQSHLKAALSTYSSQGPELNERDIAIPAGWTRQ